METQEWNARSGIQGVESKEWNLRSGIQGVESKEWNLESKDLLDYLTWGDSQLFNLFKSSFVCTFPARNQFC